MKKKSKIIATSIASIAMCASLVVGGTYALFTSESTVNIAVTSGTVNVEATIGELTLSSTVDGVTTAGVNGQWKNGGTATVDGATVTLDKMTPGDTVSFDVTVTNHSDVAVQARTIYSADGELLGGLTIDGFGEVQQTGVTLWRMLEVGSEAEVYSVSITLKEKAGNEYQGKNAAITFGVEAVQGNAQVDDPFTVTYNGTEEKFVSLTKALTCYEEAKASDVTIDIAKGTYYNYKEVEVQQLADKNLTIRADKDATFVNNASGPVFLVNGNQRSGGAETLTFEGLNFELNKGAYGIKFESGNDVRYAHNVTVQDCSFVGTDNTGFGLQADSNSSSYKIDVLDCRAEGIDTFVSIYSTALTVSDCTATNINGFVNNQTEESAVTNLVGCDATVNGNEAGYVVRVNGGDLDVTNSTLTLASKMSVAGAIVVRRHEVNVTLSGNAITATVADGENGEVATVYELKPNLASVTSDKDFTLITAVNDKTELASALKAGGNVVLAADIEAIDVSVPADVTATLNLNGHKIFYTATESDTRIIHVHNGANLTIKDSVGSGKITYNSNEGSYNGYTVWVEGELVLESGTLEKTGVWAISYAVDVRPNAWSTAYTKDTTFTMNGGKIVCDGSAIRVAYDSSTSYPAKSSSFTMDGGVIEATGDGIFVHQTDAYFDSLNVTVNGGEIKGGRDPIRIWILNTPTNSVDKCMTISLKSDATLTYTGDETPTDWLLEDKIRYTCFDGTLQDITDHTTITND